MNGDLPLSCYVLICCPTRWSGMTKCTYVFLKSIKLRRYFRKCTNDLPGFVIIFTPTYVTTWLYSTALVYIYWLAELSKGRAYLVNISCFLLWAQDLGLQQPVRRAECGQRHTADVDARGMAEDSLART